MDRSQSCARRARGLLAAALILGLIRFFRLGEWSLWHDEVLTLHDALRVLAGDGPWPSHPLGVFTVALYLKLGPGGWPDEFSLRILPAILGWLSIPLSYWAFADVASKERRAAAALLLALSTWHVYWSQNARFYTLAQDLSLLGAGLFLRGLFRNRRALIPIGILIAGLAPLAHLSGGLVLAGLIAAPLLLRLSGDLRGDEVERSLKWIGVLGVLAAMGGFALFYGPWRTYLAKKGVGIFEGLGGWLDGVSHFVLTTGYYVTPLLGAGALVGAFLAWRSRRTEDRLVFLVAGLGMAVSFVASFLAVVTAQYVFVLLPWVALLATVPLEAGRAEASGSEPGRGQGLRVAYLAVLALPALASTAIYFAQNEGERPQWRAAYRYVWNERGDEDLVLGLASPVGEYYLNPGHADLRNPERVARLDDYNDEVPGLWLRYDRKTWFVIQRDRLNAWDGDARREMLRVLAQECRMVKEFPLIVGTRDLSLSVYVRD